MKPLKMALLSIAAVFFLALLVATVIVAELEPDERVTHERPTH